MSNKSVTHSEIKILHKGLKFTPNLQNNNTQELREGCKNSLES